MLNFIFDAIGGLIDFIGEIVTTIINGVISFLQNVVGWFKGLQLRKNRHVPFIADANKPEFKKMLKTAPTKNVGLFEGVYDEQEDKITEYQYLDADGIDAKTRQTLGNEALVVLN